jgi:hypothetical protein
MTMASKLQRGVTEKDLRNTVLSIFDTLYVDDVGGGPYFDPNKEWDVGMLETVAELVNAVAEGVSKKPAGK